MVAAVEYTIKELECSDGTPRECNVNVVNAERVVNVVNAGPVPAKISWYSKTKLIIHEGRG